MVVVVVVVVVVYSLRQVSPLSSCADVTVKSVTAEGNKQLVTSSERLQCLPHVNEGHYIDDITYSPH